MTARERIARLRELIAQLERLPRTPSRDSLILQTRSRVVAVETGDAVRDRWSAERGGGLCDTGPRDRDSSRRAEEQGALARQLTGSALGQP